MRRTYQRCKPIRDENARRQYRLQHLYCQCCGIRYMDAERRDGKPLCVHHLIRFRRSDEVCNMLVACLRCHMTFHGALRIDGKEYPAMPLGVQLSLKCEHDAENWNPDRLAELYGHELPEFGDVPDVIADEWERNRGLRFVVRRYGSETDCFDGKVKVTVCCCHAPGSTPKGCAIVSGNKTPCRCNCHRKRC